LTHKILSFLGASLKVDEEQGSQRLEITIELEAGSTLNVPDINEENRRRYPHLRTTGEPSIEELIKTSLSMRRQRVALHATSKSYFAKHITSCLTTWGTDISHVPIGGEDEFETPVSETASPLGSEAQSVSNIMQSSEEQKNDELQQQSLNANLPPTFIIIDDDIDTLKNQLSQLRKAPFQLKAMTGRQKRQGQASTSSSQTTAVIHFTSLANYKSVKDIIQYITSPTTTGSFSLPQVLVIPKPAGPRRFLTALHTTTNKRVVDPIFMPMASPMSPGQKQSGIDPDTNPLDSATGKITESPGNYFPPDAASMFRPGTPLAPVGKQNPISPGGLLITPKQSGQRGSSPSGCSQNNPGPLSPVGNTEASNSPVAGLAIGTSPSKKTSSTPPPPSPSVQNQSSTQSSRFINNVKNVKNTTKTSKTRTKNKINADTVIPPVNVLIVEGKLNICAYLLF
jgi:osomolarity two-component system, response regulator SSK1